MSYEYDQYLAEHKQNVLRAFKWMEKNIPEVLSDNVDWAWQIGLAHDESKSKQDEYEAYDAYFYGNNKSHAVVEAFNKAWLNHIHRNPHHWQHWILIEDDAEEGMVIIDMPDHYIIEMICDWWSFSWGAGDLTTIFKWYGEHNNIKFSKKTRDKVENILDLIRRKLEEQKDVSDN